MEPLTAFIVGVATGLTLDVLRRLYRMFKEWRKDDEDEKEEWNTAVYFG